MTAACDFPLFSQRFLAAQPPDGQEGAPAAGGAAGAARQEPEAGTRRPAGPAKGLKVLDLRALPRDDGPPTELRARKDKLAFFDRHCTRVAEGLFVAGETVAKSRELLRGAGITHVVNCVGFLYPPYFKDELDYKTLFLQDTPGEDIVCVLYDVFDFIEGASGGNVLVHCSQGVSRSTALAIAYLMWKWGRSYDDVFTRVKEHRGVANPNIGFICQLLQWYKRRNSGVERCRVYRLAPQSASAAGYLVPKPVQSPGLSTLDPRGAFVVQTEAEVYVWEGARCPEDFAAAATRFAQQLVKYEGAPGPVVSLSQGREPAAFWRCLTGPTAAAAAGQDGGGDAGPPSPRENASYNKDFEMFQRAAERAAAAGGESGDSARGGRKTPREEQRDQANSPNERLRKQARNGGDAAAPSRSPKKGGGVGVGGGACGLGDVTTQELERGISLDSAAAELGVREALVVEQAAQRGSRLQRTTSDESSLIHSPLPGGRGGEEEEGDEVVSTRRPVSPTKRQIAAVAAAAARPAVPNLRLKLPGR